MKTLLLFLTLTLCILCGSVSAAETKPNIVIPYADDMGYGDLAIQNPDSKIPMPNLDRLAREGMRFTDAHSSSGKRHNPEHVMRRLRDADAMLNSGKDLAPVLQALEVTASSGASPQQTSVATRMTTTPSGPTSARELLVLSV